MKLYTLLCALTCFIVTSPVLAAPRELTVFSDGLLVEIEATARKGVAEVMLPAPLREGTLRVKPLDGGTVGQVELLPFRVPDKQQKELDSLTEQKNRLEDRLKALDTREEIFAAAAKSQSSKAPRKTKTNPDPLASVRQGTDFAITQLETVLTARRRTMQELRRVESKLDLLRKSVVGGPTVRVTTSAPAARLKVAAVLVDGGWKPRYEIRLQGDSSAQVALLAEINSPLPEGYRVRIAPTPLSDGIPRQDFPLRASTPTAVAEWRLATANEQLKHTPLPGFSFKLTNNTTVPLPAGLAAIYAAGEYLGTTRIPLTPPGSSSAVTGPQ